MGLDGTPDGIMGVLSVSGLVRRREETVLVKGVQDAPPQQAHRLETWVGQSGFLELPGEAG
ncbi:MAG: hypothetical protein WCI74_04630 [Actinomycetes bacterium]